VFSAVSSLARSNVTQNIVLFVADGAKCFVKRDMCGI
jgi:hypothetical protein